jgi:hypothetical protein
MKTLVKFPQASKQPMFQWDKLSSSVCAGVLLLLAPITSLAQTTNVITSPNLSTLQTDISQGGQILLAFSGTVTLTGTITINNNTTIYATNTGVVISGGGANRIFYVPPGVTLNLLNITLSGGNNIGFTGAVGSTGSGSGGRGGDGSSGGAGMGGAIYNSGTLAASNCLFLTNNAVGGSGGAGGNGGSAFISGSGGNGGNGGVGYGGAIYNTGTLVLTNCELFGNGAVGGNGGVYGTNGNGYNGVPGNGGAGAAGIGAAIYNTGSATIAASTLAFNFAAGGSSPAAGGPTSNGSGTSGFPGAQGEGGAIYNSGSDWVVNCTFDQNEAAGGAGGAGAASGTIGGNGGNGGNALGAGVFNDSSGSFWITNCTFASGTCIGGTNGVAGTGPQKASNGNKGTAGGAAIANSGALYLANSIVAYPTNTSNVYGSITDENYNISSDSSPSFSQSHSVHNTDPLLAALASNGGPTQTMALQSGSPAINAVLNNSGPAVDQRGFPRNDGINDIGAYEYGSYAIYSLSGSVTNSAGVAIQSVLMTNISTGYTNNYTTDSNGYFTFTNLSSGTYTVTPTLFGYTFNPSTWTVTVPTTANTQNFEGIISQYAITGQITISPGTNGYPSNFVVLAGTDFLGNTVGPYTRRCDANGVFSFPGLSLNAGTYEVTPQPVSNITFSPSVATVVLNSNTNVIINAIIATFTESGTISGLNGAEVAVNVIAVSGTNQYTGYYTGPTGVFSIPGITAGTYVVKPDTNSISGVIFEPASYTNSGPPSITTNNFTALYMTNTPKLSTVYSANRATISFTGVPGITYRLMASTNLSTWADIGNAVPGANSNFTMTVTNTGSGQRFFKAVTP